MPIRPLRALSLTLAYSLSISGAIVALNACFDSSSGTAPSTAPAGAATSSPATAPTTTAAAASTPAEDLADFHAHVEPVLQKYCFDCHAGGAAMGGFSMEKSQTMDDLLAAKKHWQAALTYVHKRQMPPADAQDQPSREERTVITNWIERAIYHLDPRQPDPGRVTLRRLNRTEYNNTIRDLVGVDFQPAADFPADDAGYGFDNIGDVLTVPTMLLEKYLGAADQVLDAALPTAPPKSIVRHYPATQTEIGFNATGDRGDGWVQLITLEEDDVALELPLAAGDYLVRFQAFAEPTGGAVVGFGSRNADPNAEKEKPPTPILAVFAGPTWVKDFEISTDEAHPGTYEARVGVPNGKTRLRVVARRTRGGANELLMTNGKVGKQQPGVFFIKSMDIEGPLPERVSRVPAAALKFEGDGKFNDRGHRVLSHNGNVSTEFTLEKDADMILRAEAYANQAGDETAKMQFLIDGRPAQTFEVLAPATLLPLPRQRLFEINLLDARPYMYEIRQKLPAGKHTFAAAFINDFEDPKAENPNLRDRNLIVSYLETVNLNEPLPTPEMPAAFARNFSRPIPPPPDQKLSAAREIVTSFARRAWRRPASPQEVDHLMALFTLADKGGETFHTSLKLALKGVLVSPHFLFRGEMQPDPDNPRSVHAIDEFALATRLSYFLWSSTPDDELLALAEKNQLRANLPAQIQRMIASPKSASLVDNFASQWLHTRDLTLAVPDKTLFPQYDNALREAMQQETAMFFDSIMREDKSVLEFLTADYTFVNARLARYYGMDDVNGEEFRKVSLAGTNRTGGLLTQASVLTLTSNPTRTSPVKRGKWVLENLLNAAPPPPPPNIPQLAGDSDPNAGTLRQQMEKHRADPTCASCHAQMDPIGFAMEHFDAIGRWRDTDGEAKIEAVGELPDGSKIGGPADIAKILITTQREDFLRCLTEKMLTYALGRGVEYYDRPAVDKIIADMDAHGDKFSTLIAGIIDSVPFQKRRGEDAAADRQ